MLLTIGYIEKNKQIKQCYNIHEHTYKITLQKEFLKCKPYVVIMHGTIPKIK
jgi:hypothetical protein